MPDIKDYLETMMSLEPHYFRVTVWARNEAEAQRALNERVSCDEDYGFPYVIEESADD